MLNCFAQTLAWDTLTLSRGLDWDVCRIPLRLQRKSVNLIIYISLSRCNSHLISQSVLMWISVSEGWNCSVLNQFLSPVFEGCVYTSQHQLKHKHRHNSSASLILRVHPWRETYGCHRNMTKWLCSCLSRANVNIWRANVVSSQEMSTGIRGGQASSITCATTILGLSCDVMEPTWLQCALSTAWALEETLKAMTVIDCMTLGRTSSHKITPLFQIPKRSCNLPV